MIHFRRNGQKNCTSVEAIIDSGLNTDKPIFPFGFECDDAEYAELLRIHLQEKLDKSIERAYRLAYNLGWDDHRKKHKKKTLFSTGLDIPQSDIGYEE